MAFVSSNRENHIACLQTNIKLSQKGKFCLNYIFKILNFRLKIHRLWWNLAHFPTFKHSVQFVFLFLGFERGADLEQGTVVSFDIEQGEKGLVATNVKVISPPAASQQSGQQYGGGGQYGAQGQYNQGGY